MTTPSVISLAQPWMGEEEIEAVAEVIHSNWITEGPKTREWERRIADYIGRTHGAAVCNGTQALYVGLVAMGIGPGDEVIVPDFTFIASSNAVIWAGARPVFVDVEWDTFNMDPRRLEAAITPRTKAIMVVHIFGQPADMDPICAIAERRGIPIIEDACQAFGVTYRGRKAGDFSQVACFSFFADKSITTGGEGGMVLTDDASVYDRVLNLKNQGRPGRGYYIHPNIGYNFRTTDIQSAIGLVQLRKLEEIIAHRREAEQVYRRLLAGVPGVAFPAIDSRGFYVPFRVNVLVDDPDGLMKFLDQQSVHARRFYYPLHDQPGYKAYRMEGEFPNSIRAYARGLSLPVTALLTQDQITYICGKVREFVGRKVS